MSDGIDKEKERERERGIRVEEIGEPSPDPASAIYLHFDRKTHDLFTSYFDGKSGWKVTRHAYTLETAYAVEFVHKPSGFVEGKDKLRTIGFNSEMDALKG